MRDMRLLIFQLHPPELETEGLAAVLQARLAAVKARAGLQTEFRVESERRLPMAVEEDLYWIAQEALNNVLKHAKAQHVSVWLLFTPASIRTKYAMTALASLRKQPGAKAAWGYAASANAPPAWAAN